MSLYTIALFLHVSGAIGACVSIVFLMTTKPSLTTSIMVMVIALACGLLSGVPYWYTARRWAKSRAVSSDRTSEDPFVRYPIAEARGLCLYSTATQKGDLSALASLHDTSRKSEDFTGRSDKTPVLIQNLPDKERYPLCTLFYPGSGSIPASLFRNPVSSLGGQSASRLSLLGRASGWWLCHLTLQSALAQGQYSTSVLRQKLAKWLGIQSVPLVFWLGSAVAAAGNSSPWLNASNE